MSRIPTNTARAGRFRKIRTPSSALEIIEQRFLKKDPAMKAMVEQATLNAHIAKLIYEARVAAGLTQKQLAELIGTRQPVIARLESSEYEGHSLNMLQKIAKVLGRRLDIRLSPAKRELARG